METEFIPRDKEFFECDCYDKSHLIRAEYSKYTITYPDDTTSTERELNLVFTTRFADYDIVYAKDNRFIQMKDRWVWRFKKMWQILVTGEIELEGYFTPCRSMADTHKNEIENLFGYKTTKDLAKWLDTKADEIKADYEKDYANYYKNIPGAIDAD